MAELTTIRVLRWVVSVDLAATRQAFAELAASNVPETCCNCRECRNFAAAQYNLFSPETRELFGRLGLDARYPSEVVHYNQVEPGMHFYGGWFHFIGRLLDGAAPEDSAGNAVVRDFEAYGENFVMRFTTQYLPKPRVFCDKPIVGLEFEMNVPWVLDEREPT